MSCVNRTLTLLLDSDVGYKKAKNYIFALWAHPDLIET